MKKVIFILVAVLGFATANAQDHFKAGDVTLSGKVTGLDFSIMNYDGVDDSYINVDFGIDGSYFVIDRLAVTAGVGLQSTKFGDDSNTDINFTIGARYYVWDALFAGIAYTGVKRGDEGADLLNYGGIQVGYTYYLSDKVFFEPALNFNMGFGDTNKVTQFGLSIGIGINF